ncbi:hypothetical protein KJ975_03965 [Myxococcota bacterium]|nr:hypothetical protein [Myxococcota bacterium]
MSIYKKEIDRTIPANDDIRRILPEVLDDLGIFHDREWYFDPANVRSVDQYYLLPTFNHDPETHGLYEYDIERDRIVISGTVLYVRDDNVIYRVLYRAVLERHFAVEMIQRVQSDGLAKFVDNEAAYEKMRPFLPGLAKFRKLMANCKVSAEKVFAWREQHSVFLVWENPVKATVRRVVMFAIEKERCDERAYRLEHQPELFKTEEDN